MKTSSSVGLMSAVTMPMTWPSRFEQRPARVARVDRRIDLDQAMEDEVAVGDLERAVEARDDAGAHRAAQPERAAHRVGLAALAHGGRVAEDGGHEVGDRFGGADDRDVVLGLAGDDLAARLGAVGEGQLDLGRIRDDVEAGQDVALERDDDAAAEAAVLVGLAGLGGSLGLDQDERGQDRLVDQRREGRRGRDRCERIGHGVIHVLLRQRRTAGDESAVEEDGQEGDDGSRHERRRAAKARTQAIGSRRDVRSSSRRFVSHLRTSRANPRPSLHPWPWRRPSLTTAGGVREVYRRFARSAAARCLSRRGRAGRVRSGRRSRRPGRPLRRARPTPSAGSAGPSRHPGRSRTWRAG